MTRPRGSAAGVAAAAFASLGVVAVVACAGGDAAPVGASAADAREDAGAPERACASGEKSCPRGCAALSEPATGCGAPSCAPCALPGAEAFCGADGACAVGACAVGRGDCDAEPTNGCEEPLATSARHCGACGRACDEGEACAEGICVPAEEAAAAAWLASRTSAFCAAKHNQILNLCGDVRYCFDARFLRAYPEGLAVDVGFVLGRDGNANVLSFGGDCDGELAVISVIDGALLVVGQSTPTARVAIAPGRHVVSAQWSTRGSAVFVDGRRVAEMGAPPRELRLGARCGPGLVLGNRMSYWWEKDKTSSHASAAFFFAHLRGGVADAAAWSPEVALREGPHTVLLFDDRGAGAGTWTASVGGVVGVAKNAHNAEEDPRVDAPPDGPLPAWGPLAGCAVD